jgi:hypothetical protein
MPQIKSILWGVGYKGNKIIMFKIFSIYHQIIKNKIFNNLLISLNKPRCKDKIKIINNYWDNSSNSDNFKPVVKIKTKVYRPEGYLGKDINNFRNKELKCKI